MSGELAGLLTLMGTDASAIRTNYNFSLLERIVNSQRKSSLDIVIALISNFVTLINFFSFYQLPSTAPYVLGLSVVFMAVAIGFWWKERNRGYELLERATKFGIFLDELKRYRRQLQVADLISGSAQPLQEIKDSIKQNIRLAIESLDALIKDLSETDYTTLGQKKEDVRAEIEAARPLVAPEKAGHVSVSK